MEDLSTTQCAALKKKYDVVVDKVGHYSISYEYFVNEVGHNPILDEYFVNEVGHNPIFQLYCRQGWP